MSEKYYIVLTADGTLKKSTSKTTEMCLEQLQDLVGGMIQGIHYKDVFIMMNEEGIALELKRNRFIPEVLGDVVVGSPVGISFLPMDVFQWDKTEFWRTLSV